MALSHDHYLRNDLSVHRGNLTSEPAAKAQSLDFVTTEELVAA